MEEERAASRSPCEQLDHAEGELHRLRASLVRLVSALEPGPTVALAEVTEELRAARIACEAALREAQETIDKLVDDASGPTSGILPLIGPPRPPPATQKGGP
jgi:hypothetical protein